MSTLSPEDIVKMSDVVPRPKKKKKIVSVGVDLNKVNTANNKKLLKYVHLRKQNDVYKLDCHLNEENCEKIRNLSEISKEAGYKREGGPTNTKGYKELMAGWDDEIQARATGDIALDAFDKKMQVISKKSLAVSELSTDLLLKAMQKKFEDPDFIDKMSEMGMEKLSNVLNKTAKTSQLLAGKATENVAVGVKIEVSPQRANTMSIFQQQQSKKEEHRKESAKKAREAIKDAEIG